MKNGIEIKKCQITGATFFASCFLIFNGCASAPKADLYSSTADGAIKEVVSLKQEQIKMQNDLFAPKAFEKGLSKISKAKEAFRSEKETKKVLKYASQAKGYLLRTEKKANKKRPFLTNVLPVRKKATDSSYRYTKKGSENLYSIDEELREKTSDFQKTLSNADFSKIQKMYLGFESKAVQYENLYKVRMVLKSAKANGADEKAPSTLKVVSKDLLTAENLIARNVRNKNAYMNSVLKAKSSAKLLNDVMNRIENLGEGTTEKAALNLVYQDRRIGQLSSDLDDAKFNLALTREDMMATTEALGEAQKTVDVQGLMSKARQQFDESEAEVYQKGNKLVIRLKSLNFKTGSSKIPANSKTLMSKVVDVVQSFDPDKIKVAGHTDSLGDAAFNRQLSQARAKSVKKYMVQELETSSLDIITKGYGEKKPLASNSTDEGRAQNRRVDIILTAKI